MSEPRKAGPGPAAALPRIRMAHIAMGLRQPSGRLATLLVLIGLAWSMFQLWIASPLPELLNVGSFNQARIRSLHLAFAVLLAFLAYTPPAASRRVTASPGPIWCWRCWRP